MKSIVEANQSTLLAALPFVKVYDERLCALNTWWGKISLIGKINSQNVASTILEDMLITKAKFGDLQKKLIQSLLLENVQKRVLDDSSRSQVVIDILIRNLFERTADVGFLSTDDDIRRFLLNPSPSDNETCSIESRLDEYVKKYSVYDEIIILDNLGNVCAHLDKANPIHRSTDALIQETLETNEEYVETFGHSDLQPNLQHSLIYSCKITASNETSSPTIGVLCLCFRFDNEMDSIFGRLLQKNDSSTLMVLNSKGRAIASSNTTKVPLNSAFKLQESARITDHRSNKVLANTTKTRGYEGFFGLGWLGQVITPIEDAFKLDDACEMNSFSSEELNQAKMFSAELKEIHRSSIDVNDDLSLVVLNGKITASRQDATEFMPVLEEIKKIGEDTASIFEDSISKLLTTVVSSRLGDTQFMAALAVDIMDRNLYERANDSRWWALTSAFREILAQPHIDETDTQKLSSILNYINELYTVYTNLYVYDKHGKILAVSNAEEQRLVGTLLDEQTGAAAALKINNSQEYTVSPFVKTPLYNNRHTYIYNASITAPSHSNEPVIGGIGIVFDSEPQFESMLADVLPQDENGELVEGCFSVFCERSGRILSAAHNPQLQPGGQLEVEKRFFELENGGQTSEIIRYQGSDYALGVAVSQGYREYKTTADYDNDVIGFVFMPF